jgi:hypothetical protein
MCLQCGNCAAEHGYSLDEAVDTAESNPAKSYIQP